MQVGADPLTAWYASTNVLNLMQAITGNQWRSVSSGVRIFGKIEYQACRSILNELLRSDGRCREAS